MLSFTPFEEGAVILYVILAVAVGRNKKTTGRRQVLVFAFFLYLLEVVSVTLFPIPYQSLRGYIQGNNVIPFQTILGIFSEHSLSNDLRNIGGNILLFVPFGFLFPLVFRKPKRATKMIAIGFVASLIVETSQFTISCALGITYRSFDVDDLMLNTVGAFIGYLLLRVVQKRAQYPHSLRPSRQTWPIASSLGVIIVFASYWGYEYSAHSTPQRAQESYDSNVLSFETVPFAKGDVLITPTDPATSTEPGYVAWYMEKSNFWGWRLKAKSEDPLNEGQFQHGITLQSMAIDGQTFVWGTSGNSGAQEMIYRHNGKTYRGQVERSGTWHIILSFSQSQFTHSDWTVILRNGNVQRHKTNDILPLRN